MGDNSFNKCVDSSAQIDFTANELASKNLQKVADKMRSLATLTLTPMIMYAAAFIINPLIGFYIHGSCTIKQDKDNSKQKAEQYNPTETE